MCRRGKCCKHHGEAPSLTSVAEGAAYALELERQRAIVEKQGLKPVFGYDVTADDSQTAAQLLEAKNPEFKEWAKEVYRYSDDLIRYRVEAGLITPEFANHVDLRLHDGLHEFSFGIVAINRKI